MANPIKLTEAQTNVLVELNNTGALPKGTRGSTLEKLEGYGFIELVVLDYPEDISGWIITNEGQEQIGAPVVDREANARIQELEDLLKPVFSPEQLEALSDIDDSIDFAPDVYDNSLPNALKANMGFAVTFGWKGTEVWDGLTADEIRADMDTARPINRKARRTHFRTLRNAFRRQTVLRPRKALKITGTKGI